MISLVHDSAQSAAHRALNVMPQSLQNHAKQSAHRIIRAALTPYVMTIHLLQGANELRVSYPWSAPTAPEVIANYTRGFVLLGRSGSRWVPFEWRSFPVRAVITPETAKVPKRLRSIRRRGELEIRFDKDFEEIIQCCRTGRITWITPELIDIYREVHRLGFVVTAGTYRDGQLVGGLWGIGVGRVFGIMSMFHREDHAGALAMAALVDAVGADGRWSVIDCGSPNRNFERYGAKGVSHPEFCELMWSRCFQSLRGSGGDTELATQTRQVRAVGRAQGLGVDREQLPT